MNIYLRNLASEVTADELRAAFSRYGRVDEIVTSRGGVPGEPNGLAMVVMPIIKSARAAMEAVDGTTWKGQVVDVSERPPP